MENQRTGRQKFDIFGRMEKSGVFKMKRVWIFKVKKKKKKKKKK